MPIRLTWIPPEVDDPSTIIGYKLYKTLYPHIPTLYDFLTVVQGNVLTYDDYQYDRHLLETTGYTYKVTALIGHIESEVSNVAHIMYALGEEPIEQWQEPWEYGLFPTEPLEWRETWGYSVGFSTDQQWYESWAYSIALLPTPAWQESWAYSVGLPTTQAWIENWNYTLAHPGTETYIEQWEG